jgi:hypothetical protein
MDAGVKEESELKLNVPLITLVDLLCAVITNVPLVAVNKGGLTFALFTVAETPPAGIS